VHRGLDQAVVDPRAHPLTPTPLPWAPKTLLPEDGSHNEKEPRDGAPSAMPDLPTPEAEAEAAAAAEAAEAAAEEASNRT
jgi:hypothetical protein